MSNATATEVYSEIRERVESIVCSDTQRFPEAASPGDTARQGDIYITLLDGVTEGFSKCKVELQLAPGTTKGSRHILSHDRVEMFRDPNADVLTGPVVKCSEEVSVTHPEHGNVILPPGTYAITYQRAFAEELKRQLD